MQNNREMKIGNGRGEWIRTTGLFVPNEANDTQKNLQTLGETQPTEKCVTRNVTHFPETSLETSLVEVLRELPKDELLRLLMQALSER